MKTLSIAAFFVTGFLLLGGCSEQSDETSKSSQSTENKVKQEVAKNSNETLKVQPVSQNQTANTTVDPHANLKMPANAMQSAPTARGMNRGVAANVIHSGGYTYVEVNNNGKSIWLAGSQTPIKPGQELYWGEAAVMRNFSSKSLDRTFPEILFVSKFVTQRPTARAPTSANASSGKVLSAQTAAGYSYLEVKSGEQVLWIAAPAAKVNVNDTVSWNGGSKMSNFTSKSLGKTFNEIFFVGSVSVTK